MKLRRVGDGGTLHEVESEKCMWCTSCLMLMGTVGASVQLNREIAAVKDLLASLKEIVFTRLDGMDKALELSNHNLSRVPSEVERQVEHLKEVQGERFRSIETQFKERDSRAEQREQDGRIRVEAAFSAAKEAVSEQNRSFMQATQKSDLAVMKQIDQIMTQIQSAKESRDDAIGALKDRLTLIEGKGYGPYIRLFLLGMMRTTSGRVRH